MGAYHARATVRVVGRNAEIRLHGGSTAERDQEKYVVTPVRWLEMNMTTKSLWFCSSLLVTQLVSGLFCVVALAAEATENVNKRIDVLETRVDALGREATIRLDGNEKLMQAKMEHVVAIAQTLENGRKDVDWWLNGLANILTAIAVLAVLIPMWLQWSQKKQFDAEVRSIQGTFESLRTFERDTKTEMRSALEDLRRAKLEVRDYVHSAEEGARKVESASKYVEQLMRTPVEDKSPEEFSSVAKKLRETETSPLSKVVEKAYEFMAASQWGEAATRWRVLTDTDPENASLWYNLGYALQRQAKTEDANRLWLLQEAGASYATAVRIRPDTQGAYSNWGIALSDWARELPPIERPAKFAEAGDKYAAAIRIKPDDPHAYYNWGSALIGWALVLPQTERAAKYAEASEKYAEAVRIKPDFNAAYHNWGGVLNDWAQVLPPEEQSAKFAEAEEKYVTALHITPDDYEAYCNWGRVLLAWALALPLANRPGKLAEAGKKFAKAVQIKPSYHEAYASWGSALFEWARALPLVERPHKLAEAREKLLLAEQYSVGAGSYDLACIAALSGNTHEAQHWLENCRVHKTLPDCDNLRTDKDIDSLRALDWFEAMLEKECGAK